MRVFECGHASEAAFGSKRSLPGKKIVFYFLPRISRIFRAGHQPAAAGIKESAPGRGDSHRFGARTSRPGDRRLHGFLAASQKRKLNQRGEVSARPACGAPAQAWEALGSHLETIGFPNDSNGATTRRGRFRESVFLPRQTWPGSAGSRDFFPARKRGEIASRPRFYFQMQAERVS